MEKQHNLIVLSVEEIAPSPYQHRRYFDEATLKELAFSIQRDGLVEPIVVRLVQGRHELIAGERRLRAVKGYTDMKRILANVVEVNDLQARRMSASENLQREDLSAIETIEAMVEIVDAELMEEGDYHSMGKTSLEPPAKPV